MRGVPHNKDPPSPGQEKGPRSKTTQGEGMRSSSSWIARTDRLEITP